LINLLSFTYRYTAGHSSWSNERPWWWYCICQYIPRSILCSWWQKSKDWDCCCGSDSLYHGICWKCRESHLCIHCRIW